MTDRSKFIALRRVPLVLVACLAPLVAGCLIVPLPPETMSGVNAGAKVGRAGSWTRPLKVGRATRGDVEAALGRPDYKSIDGKQWSYGWTTRSAVALAPFAPFVNAVESLSDDVAQLRR